MTSEYTFNGQRDGEKVNHIIRQHPYVMYTPLSRTAGLLLIVLIQFLFFPAFYWVTIIIVAFIALYLSNRIYAYNESVFLITSERIFLIEQKGFFKRKIYQTDIDKIIDMVSETEGFSRTMLKFGNLVIRTAGAREGGDIVLTNVPNPYQIQQKIMKVMPNLDN